MADVSVATGMKLDPATAHEVAAAYLAASVTRGPGRVVAAYAELQAQSDAFFVHLTQPDCPWSVRVVFTGHQEPDATDRELIDAVRSQRVLEVPVTSGHGTRSHPMLGDGALTAQMAAMKQLVKQFESRQPIKAPRAKARIRTV